MRREELHERQEFDLVDAPALADAAEPVPQPAAAVPDMPKAAGAFMIAAYAAIMCGFIVTIHGAHADFAILVGMFYLVMLIGIPAVFLGIENDPARRPALFEFLDRGMETATGRISGAGALTQMLIVPVLLAFAVLAMGVTYLLS